MNRLKTITLPRGYDGLHIELPGSIINIHTGLTSLHGHEVVSISVDADGDRYAGDPEWWCLPGDVDRRGAGIRIVQCPAAEIAQEAD